MGFFNDFKILYCDFGIRAAYKLAIKPRVYSKLGINSFSDSFNSSLLNYLENEYRPVIDKYRDIEKLGLNTTNCKFEKKIIWTCWWQGEEQMPDVIKLCNKSLLKNSNGHEVVLITKDNYNKYVDIPLGIIDKVNKGDLSLTHMGDVIRVALLARYGGIWIDAALFVVRPIVEHKNFFSPKILSNSSTFVSGHKWCVGMLEVEKNDLLFLFVRDCFYHYLLNNKGFVYYFQFDFTIQIAYLNLKVVKDVVDSVPYNNQDLHSSRYSFNNKVDVKHFQNLVENNNFLSLTWRIKYEEYLPDGELTYYGKLIEYSGLNN